MDFIKVGKIVNTHGIKGELRIKSNFEKKDKVFKSGITLYVGKGYVPEKIVTYRPHKEFDMVTFEGYNNINQVLNYLKMDVYVKREDLELKNDEYVLEEILDFSIVENGEVLGKVCDIVYNSSNVLLSVKAEKNFYIPYKGDFIKRVDLEKKEIIVENAKELIL